jgi:transposase
MTGEREVLTDARWVRLAPLLPTNDGKEGKPWGDHRRVINGILWKLRTGAPWRDLPARYGPWSTCADRFVRWRRDGTWDRLLHALHGAADAGGAVAWEVSLDSSVIRAHQHAAGARHQPSQGDAKGGSGTRPTRRSAAAAAG